MPHIFISYRRDDTAYVAGMLCQRLQTTFGPQSIFFDVDNIPLGVDFRTHLSGAVAQCDVLLAILGSNWQGASPAGGPRRIDSPADFMRIEIEAALARGIPVVPVLVCDATMPAPETLPDVLKPLSYRNAAEVRSGRDLNSHIEMLIRGLQAHFAKPKTVPAAPAEAAKQETARQDEAKVLQESFGNAPAPEVEQSPYLQPASEEEQKEDEQRATLFLWVALIAFAVLFFFGFYILKH